MSPEEALKSVRDAALHGALEYTTHARQQMELRNARREDVKAALRSTSVARPDPPPEAKWRFEGGKDVDGEDLMVVAECCGWRWRIVTVF